MERYLRKSVREVIGDFPEAGEILDRFGIGCVPCSIGTCKLEEVVEIHALSPQHAAQMMAEIEQAIYPEREVVIPAAPPVEKEETVREITCSPPVRKLVEEHTWIKRLLAMIPAIVEDLRASGEMNTAQLREILDFIRGYADRFHHMKEEDILFDYTDEEAEIIQVIYADHDRARGFVKAASQAIEDEDISAFCVNLSAYRNLLTQHIAKEDEVLFPYIDRGLSTHQVGEIFSRFAEAESESGEEVPRKYEHLILELEKQFKDKEIEGCHTPTKDVRAPA